MLRELIADHTGMTKVYYFQIPFDETIRRHSTRPLADVVSPEQMRDWYHAADLLGVPDEQIIEESSSLDDTAKRVIDDLDWVAGGPIAHGIED
jgi:hypothetical protein